MKTIQRIALAAAALFASTAALADITIGVTMPLTGPASGLGIPMQNGFKLWPETIAGEKVKLIILDDATDPTKGVQNARKLATEDKVDVIFGSGATPVAIAIVDVAIENKVPQIALSPIGLPPGKDTWSFRLPQNNAVMAEAMVAHMVKGGVKSVGFIGYTDAYGELWLQALTPRLEKAGIKLVATERFARTDTSVTAQALKITSANPDAVVVVATGSGAAMPQLGIAERGFKGKYYQTHAAATKDLMRVGGKTVEGTFVTSGPVVVVEQLPDGHPSKAVGLKFVQAYEKANGAGSRNQFAAHTWDGLMLLEAAVPIALKTAKPGTPEFRSALRDALESAPAIPVTHGVLDYKADDHWGFGADAAIVMKVVDGDWKLEAK
jgi:branched-chain amino acid transport system substrate-binding protein